LYELRIYGDTPDGPTVVLYTAHMLSDDPGWDDEPVWSSWRHVAEELGLSDVIWIEYCPGDGERIPEEFWRDEAEGLSQQEVAALIGEPV
jgi:hypothetical protein